MTSVKKKSFTARYVKVMFSKVKPGWKKILLGPLKKQLFKVFKAIDSRLSSVVTHADVEKNGLGHYIRPAPCDILRAFTFFEPDEMRAIIVGQDPYTRLNQAMGLSFSVPRGETVPPSLKNKLDTQITVENIQKCYQTAEQNQRAIIMGTVVGGGQEQNLSAMNQCMMGVVANTGVAQSLVVDTSQEANSTSTDPIGQVTNMISDSIASIADLIGAPFQMIMIGIALFIGFIMLVIIMAMITRPSSNEKPFKI